MTSDFSEVFYVLDGDKRPVVASLREWGVFHDSLDRIVKQDQIGDVFVSTVFLGVDHGAFRSGGPPLLFETMIFGGEHDGYQDRCSTWDEAERMHATAIGIATETTHG